MNKKQAGIIVTLLALIVCAGILAARVNGPLEVASNGLTQGTISQSGNKNTKTDYFVDSRLIREQQDAQTLANYRAILDDKNVSATEKKTVEQKQTQKATNMDYESRIETTLKGQGFEDAICLIEDEQVRIIVKAKELTQQDRKKIQDTVTSISKIKVVAIENRQ